MGTQDLNALIDVAAEALAQLVTAVVFVLSHPHLGLLQAGGAGADCLLACQGSSHALLVVRSHVFPGIVSHLIINA